MPTTTPTAPAEAAPPADAAHDSPSSGITKKLLLAAIALAVVLVELVLAYVYFPSPQQAAALATQTVGDRPLPEVVVPDDTGRDQEEVDMGKFTVTAYQPASNMTLRIDFHLFGTVYADQKQEFIERMTARENRVRDHIYVTIRSVNLADLTDAGLGLIKRRILETTNQTLGKPLLQAVVFREFTFIEQ